MSEAASSPTPSADEQSARVHGAKEAVIAAARDRENINRAIPDRYLSRSELALRKAVRALDALSK